MDAPPLGVDPEVWAALPEDVRREFMPIPGTTPTTTTTTTTSDNAASSSSSTRQPTTTTEGGGPADLDIASFFATISDPELRMSVLLSLPNEVLYQLPPEMRVEADVLRQREQQQQQQRRNRPATTSATTTSSSGGGATLSGGSSSAAAANNVTTTSTSSLRPLVTPTATGAARGFLVPPPWGGGPPVALQSGSGASPSRTLGGGGGGGWGSNLLGGLFSALGARNIIQNVRAFEGNRLVGGIPDFTDLEGDEDGGSGAHGEMIFGDTVPMGDGSSGGNIVIEGDVGEVDFLTRLFEGQGGGTDSSVVGNGLSLRWIKEGVPARMSSRLARLITLYTQNKSGQPIQSIDADLQTIPLDTTDKADGLPLLHSLEECRLLIDSIDYFPRFPFSTTCPPSYPRPNTPMECLDQVVYTLCQHPQTREWVLSILVEIITSPLPTSGISSAAAGADEDIGKTQSASAAMMTKRARALSILASICIQHAPTRAYLLKIDCITSLLCLLKPAETRRFALFCLAALVLENADGSLVTPAVVSSSPPSVVAVSSSTPSPTAAAANAIHSSDEAQNKQTAVDVLMEIEISPPSMPAPPPQNVMREFANLKLGMTALAEFLVGADYDNATFELSLAIATILASWSTESRRVFCEQLLSHLKSLIDTVCKYLETFATSTTSTHIYGTKQDVKVNFRFLRTVKTLYTSAKSDFDMRPLDPVWTSLTKALKVAVASIPAKTPAPTAEALNHNGDDDDMDDEEDGGEEEDENDDDEEDENDDDEEEGHGDEDDEVIRRDMASMFADMLNRVTQQQRQDMPDAAGGGANGDEQHHLMNDGHHDEDHDDDDDHDDNDDDDDAGEEDDEEENDEEDEGQEQGHRRFHHVIDDEATANSMARELMSMLAPGAGSGGGSGGADANGEASGDGGVRSPRAELQFLSTVARLANQMEVGGGGGLDEVEEEEEEEEHDDYPDEYVVVGDNHNISDYFGTFVNSLVEGGGGAGGDAGGSALRPRATGGAAATADAINCLFQFVPFIETLLTVVDDDEAVERFTNENVDAINAMVSHTPQLIWAGGALAGLTTRFCCRKVLSFDNKKNHFRHGMRVLNASVSAHTIRLVLRRDRVFEDSLNQISIRLADEMRGRLSITFQGEEGIDAGGVTREWLAILMREVFKPGYALFMPSADSPAFQPDPRSFVNQNHLQLFHFVGRVMGKALADGHLINAHLTRSFYKHILGKEISVKDLQSLDPQFHKTLSQLLQMDAAELAVLDLFFTCEVEEFGMHRSVALKPGGSSIQVTIDNRAEYVKLAAFQKMTTGIQAQIDAFLNGFYELVPKDLIKIFGAQELELLICGLPQIDIQDWQKNSEYSGYQVDSPQIEWFWRSVKHASNEDRAKLLMFVTGTSMVPLEGFGGLIGMRGITKFSIHQVAPGHFHGLSVDQLLPTAHTCFNQLDLPAYSSYEVLNSKLWMAVSEGNEGFGLA